MIIISIAININYSIKPFLQTINKTIFTKNMNFYENTIIVRQDLASKDLKDLKDKYNKIIDDTSGKVLKIEEWGLLNFVSKIKNYNKGHYIHFKFEGNKDTVNEINKKIKVDRSIIRFLTVKLKKLDLEKEFFKKDKNE